MELLQNPQERANENLDDLVSSNERQAGNSEYYQMHAKSNDNVQYDTSNTRQKNIQYDRASQRQVFYNTQLSFNEQQVQYTGQAFNDYDLPDQPQEQNQLSSSRQSLLQESDTYISKQDSVYAEKAQSQLPEMQQYEQSIIPTDLQVHQEDLRQMTYGDQQWEPRLTAELTEKNHIGSHSPPEEKNKHAVSSEDSKKSTHENISNLSSENADSDRLKNEAKKPDRIRQRRQYFDSSSLNRSLGGQNRISFYETRKKKYGRLNFDNSYRTNKIIPKRQMKDRLKDEAGKWLKDEEFSDNKSEDLKKALKYGYKVIRDQKRSGGNRYKKDRYQARLQTTSTKENYHTNKQKRLKNSRQVQKKKIQDDIVKEKRKYQKKKIQKRQVEKERNFKIHSIQQLKMMKKSGTQKRLAVKRSLKTITIAFIIVSLFLGISVILLPVILGVTYGTGEYYSRAIVQTDYGDITAATEYFRSLETDLEEYVSASSTMESDLRESYGEDIYEIHYDLDTFGFNDNTIIAYLGAKYGTFQLDSTIIADLQDVFAEMYTLNVEIKKEYRDIEDTSTTDSNGKHPIIKVEKKICYVKLIKKELEEVVEARLTEDQLDQYQTYKLSTGGQQVYGPVMSVDWRNKISSNYGDRIHPITGERKTHKGVDIAVPTGTKLYSAIQGTVVTAKYSSSAGNMVVIQNDVGWSVTFMHMDSYIVKNGQRIEKGDFVGYSGNTGNSTGPHLHLQVTSPGGDTINPVFIIPQTCAYISN